MRDIIILLIGIVIGWTICAGVVVIVNDFFGCKFKLPWVKRGE